MIALTATVVITTKNRKHDLRRAVSSCLKQTASLEVLVVDDGSSDGTAEMLNTEFPTIRLFRDQVSMGYIVQRNRAANLAAGDIIVSIDDDADFPSPHTIAQTLAEFDSPAIAAVAIPFINVNYSDAVRQHASRAGEALVTDHFTGTAHALRRDVFLRVGGYRAFLFHQGEEEDLCIRLLDAGYFTRLGSADPIHHHESPIRDRRRMDLYGARNKVLFPWYNVPMPYILAHLPGAIVNRLLFGVRVGRPLRVARGVLKGIVDCFDPATRRCPVRPETYRLFRKLRHAREMPLSAALRELRASET